MSLSWTQICSPAGICAAAGITQEGASRGCNTRQGNKIPPGKEDFQKLKTSPYQASINNFLKIRTLKPRSCRSALLHTAILFCTESFHSSSPPGPPSKEGDGSHMCLSFQSCECVCCTERCHSEKINSAVTFQFITIISVSKILIITTARVASARVLLLTYFYLSKSARAYHFSPLVLLGTPVRT